jgi:hypothetical protein
MAAVEDLSLILHRIRVKLYANYLPGVQGEYIARTNNEKVLNTDDIATTILTRGGFTGNRSDLIDHIRQYNMEVMYQLLDGYAVTNEYFTTYVNIGGTFNTVNDTHDHKKHPLSVRFNVLSRLKKLLDKVQIDIEGLADVNGFIDEFIDLEDGYINSQCVPGNMSAVHGHKIKIAGDDPKCGVYFVPVTSPQDRLKVDRMGDNTANRITFIVPNLYHTTSRVEIVTQFAGAGDKFLKAPRTITSPFILERA